MSYSEGLRIATGAERARDMEWDNICKAEEEYEKDCDERFSELIETFEVYKRSYPENLTEAQWEDLKDYISEYEIEPDTKFYSIIENYVEKLGDKFNFIISKR